MTAGHSPADQSPSDRPAMGHQSGAGRLMNRGVDYGTEAQEQPSQQQQQHQQQQEQHQQQQKCQDGHATNTRSSYTIDETLKIYINWANYYLMKANCSTRIQNLETDLCDGIVLSHIIESVMNRTVKEICKAPTDNTNKVANVEACLRLLADCGVQVDGVAAADICRGNVKSVLSLLFNLSRYKQQQRGVIQTLGSDKPVSQQPTPSACGRGTDSISALSDTLKQDGNKHIIVDLIKQSGGKSAKVSTAATEGNVEAKIVNETAQIPDSARCSTMTGAKQSNPVTGTAAQILPSSNVNSGKMATVSCTPSGSRRGDGVVTVSGVGASFGSASLSTPPPAPGSRIATAVGPGAIKSVAQCATAVQPQASAMPISGTTASHMPATFSTSTKERRRHALEKASDSELGTDRSDAEESSVRLRASAKKGLPAATAGAAVPAALSAAAGSALSSKASSGHRAAGGSATAIPRCASSSGDSLSRSRTPSRENLTGKRVLPAISLSTSQQHVLATAAAAAQASRNRDAAAATLPVAAVASAVQRAGQTDAGTAMPEALATSTGKQHAEGEPTQPLKRPTASAGTIKKPVSPSRMSGQPQSAGSGQAALQPQPAASSAPRPTTLAPHAAVKGTALQRQHPAYATGSRREQQGKLYNQMPGLQMYVRGSDSDSGATSDGGSVVLLPSALSQGMQQHVPAQQQQQRQQQQLWPAASAQEKMCAILESQALPGQPTGFSVAGAGTQQPRAGQAKPMQAISPVTRCKEDWPLLRPQSDQVPARSNQSKLGSSAHLQRPQTLEPWPDTDERLGRQSHAAGAASLASLAASPTSPAGASPGPGLRSAGLVAPKVVGTARIATIMSLQSGRERPMPGGVQSLVDSSSNGAVSRLSNTSSSNDSNIYKPPSGQFAAASDDRSKGGSSPEGAVRSKETTFDVHGKAETRCSIGISDSRETAFDASAASPPDFRPVQPMSQLSSYDFLLRKLDPARGPGAAFEGISSSAPARVPMYRGLFGGVPQTSRLGLMHRSFETQSPAAAKAPADYLSDAEEYASAGYLSDVGQVRYSDSGSRRCRDISGYLSEDGASLYAIRMQQRFQEGMLSAKECLRKCPKFLDDGSRGSIEAENDLDSESDGKSSVSSSDINEALAGLDGGCSRASSCSDGAEQTSAGTVRLLAHGGGGGCIVPPQQCSAVVAVVKEARHLSSAGAVQRCSATGAADERRLHAGCTPAAAGSSLGDDAAKRLLPSGDALTTPLRGFTTNCNSMSNGGSSNSRSTHGGSIGGSGSRHLLGYMSDSGIGRMPQPHSTPSGAALSTALAAQAEQRQAERQRARKLISPKTQQSLAASRLHAATTAAATSDCSPAEPYKYATLGRPPTVLRRPVADFAALPPGSRPDARQLQLQQQQQHNGSTASCGSSSSSTISGSSNTATTAAQAAPSSGQQCDKGSRAATTAAAPEPGTTWDWQHIGCLPAAADTKSERVAVARSCAADQLHLDSSEAAAGRVDPEGRAEGPAPSAIQVQIRQARALSITSSKIVAMQRAAQQQQQHSLPQWQQQISQASEGWRNSTGGFCPAGMNQPGQCATVPAPAPPADVVGAGGSCTTRWLRPDLMLPAAERLSSCSNYTSHSEDDPNVHGSSQSLISSGSSMQSSMADELQSPEVRRLKRELEAARRRVAALTDQLSNNAHVVQAFEHSLSNMTLRLQHVSSTSEQKDTQLAELRSTIDHLCKMSGLAQADLARAVDAAAATDRRLSKGSTCSGSSAASAGSLPLARQMSADSTMSLSSVASSASSTDGLRRQQRQHQQLLCDGSASTAAGSSASVSSCADAASSEADRKKKKKNWLRSSFSKAFSRKRSSGAGSTSDVERGSQDHLAGSDRESSLPPVPPSPSLISITHASEESSEASIAELRRQLREKELKLTDIRLDALTSAHQLEQLREAMNKMKCDMSLLRADNERLQKLMAERAKQQQNDDERGGGKSSNFDVFDLSSPPSSSHYLSAASPVARSSGGGSVTSSRELMLDKEGSFGLFSSADSAINEGKRVTVTVASASDSQGPGTLIGSLSIGCRTKWDHLESQVKKLFKYYLCRIDSATNLGLSTESIVAFVVGEVTRTKDGELPELLPYGYLVGSTTNIQIHLKGAAQSAVDALAFDTCVPKSILHRYVSLLLEHRRVILSGPSGTGKSYLALRLAEHLIQRSRLGVAAAAARDAILSVSIEQSATAERQLQQLLGGGGEPQCRQHGDDGCMVPPTLHQQQQQSILVIDNLQHVLAVGSHAEALSSYLSNKLNKWPYIIGTLSQASGAVTSTQLCQHGFRWILCAHHIEPVKGLVGRYLRRRLVEAETTEAGHNNDLSKVIDWLPDVWHHMNKLLAVQSPGGDPALGVQAFMSCPMDAADSRRWFTTLWNAELVPLLRAAVQRSLQVHGWQAPWKDPTEWLLQTYPWPQQPACSDPDLCLARISCEDLSGFTSSVEAAPPPATSAGRHAGGGCSLAAGQHQLHHLIDDAWPGRGRKVKLDSLGQCNESVKPSIESSAAAVPSIVDVV